MHFLKIESYFNLNLSPHCFFFHQIPLDLAQGTLIECKIYFESDLKKKIAVTVRNCVIMNFYNSPLLLGLLAFNNDIRQFTYITFTYIF